MTFFTLLQQLPADVEQAEAKRVKLDDPDNNPMQPSSTGPLQTPVNSNMLSSALFPNFMPNFTAGAADATAPNFQLTHLMALFQLQNPLFYQNLYPGVAAANMVTVPQNQSIFNNLAAFGAAAAAAAASVHQPKSELSIKPEFKE